jgi:hypothetical protein
MGESIKGQGARGKRGELPIVDCQLPIEIQAKIGNRQLAIGNLLAPCP